MGDNLYTLEESQKEIARIKKDAWDAGYSRSIPKSANPYPFESFEGTTWHSWHFYGEYQRSVDDHRNKAQDEIRAKETAEFFRRRDKKWYQFWI